MSNAWLIPGLWCLWLAYWTISARGNKAVVRRESLVSRLLHLGPLAIAALLLSARSLPGGWLCGRFVPQGQMTSLAGLLIVVIGLGFTVWARVHLGRNWSGTVTLKADHELVRSGPYSIVRHPIYTGLLLGFLGSAVALGEWRGLLATALVFAGFWRKLRLEERWMREVFGPQYERYQAEVPALIPGL